VDPLSPHPQTIRRRLLRPIAVGIKIKPSISPYKMLTVWDAIDQAISVRIVIIGNTQILIIVDNGMDAKPTRSFEPVAR
jgi:alpha-D-ribose 1-methylphosphonate 5-phosphate C-P lyase